MVDINAMLRQTAQTSLESQLDEAVTAGDTEKVRKITQDIANLAVQTAPKAPAFSDADVIAQLDKEPWYGIDPKKSAKAHEFGKTMNPKKFGSAEAFAKAIKDAVEAEFAPAAPPKKEGEDADDNEPGEEDDNEPAGKPEPKARKTDGPKDGDIGSGSGRSSRGPWSKMSDAPSAVQAEIKRQADRFLPGNATKEQRAAFEARSLEAHYKAHQAKKGK